jgi:hypothetical protein
LVVADLEDMQIRFVRLADGVELTHLRLTGMSRSQSDPQVRLEA